MQSLFVSQKGYLVLCLVALTAAIQPIIVLGKLESSNDESATTKPPIPWDTGDSTETPAMDQQSTTSTKPITTTPAAKSTTTTTTVSPLPLASTTPSSTKSNDTIKSCPPGCDCRSVSSGILDCNGSNIKSIPNLREFAKTYPITDVRMRNNKIELVNFNNLPTNNLVSLDLSNNLIRQFLGPEKKKFVSFNKLANLNLSGNRIESLGELTRWEFPSLNTFDLSSNPLGQLNGSDFIKMKCNNNLISLHMNSIKLKSIDEQTFASLVNLANLSLKNTSLAHGYHLADLLFVKNQNLKKIDLSMNGFLEVPIALRMLPNLEVLRMSNNQLTSLRPSDFINMTGLKTLEMSNCAKLARIDGSTFGNARQLSEIILSDNPSLNYFSPNAFQPIASVNSPTNQNQSPPPPPIHIVKKLDLTNNNITTLTNVSEWPSVRIETIFLEQNPWDCTCAIKWLTEVQMRAQLHCKTPSVYKDMDIGLYFQTVDCELIESNPQRFVLGVFLVFLLILTIVIFIQKSDICRRLQWRDQYGTIYYTKASFPADNQI